MVNKVSSFQTLPINKPKYDWACETGVFQRIDALAFCLVKNSLYTHNHKYALLPITIKIFS